MRSVIWDLGGTLVDSYPEVDAALLAAAPGATAQEVSALTRRSSSEAIRSLAARHDVPEPVLRAAYDAVSARWATDPPPLMPGAGEVLAAVRAGGGRNLVATHRDRGSATALLAALGVAVDDLVCAPDGHARKPDPEMTRLLLERHGLEPEDAIAVGDRPGDLGAARAAGVVAYGLAVRGTGPEPPGPHRIEDLRELLPLL